MKATFLLFDYCIHVWSISIISIHPHFSLLPLFLPPTHRPPSIMSLSQQLPSANNSPAGVWPCGLLPHSCWNFDWFDLLQVLYRDNHCYWECMGEPARPGSEDRSSQYSTPCPDSHLLPISFTDCFLKE